MTGLSIGALSQACGIPANTIRTWERRYGFPSPSRTQGGHRLYNTEDVSRLRLIASALDLGFRAGQVVPSNSAELNQILNQTSSIEDSRDLLSYARNLDGPGLERAIRLDFTEHSLDDFLIHRIVPFLVSLGEAWATDLIDVHQEHFASHKVRNFIEGIWRPLSKSGEHPVILATLPGEQHDLGLHMAACILVSEGIPVMFLGAEVPVKSLATSVLTLRPKALMLGVTQHTSDKTSQKMSALLKAIPKDQEVFLGGACANPYGGVPVMNTIVDLRNWCQAAK
jgi:MerR family transcriptional regulator, light-induced transcriptional regulator